MSGTTIRDVVVKIAIEMAQSKISMPEIQKAETAASEVGAKAGKAAAKSYVEVYSKEVQAGIKSASQYWTDPTPGRKEMFGPYKPVSADETRERLNQLQRERVILGENEQVLKRNSGVLGENTKAREANVDAIKSQIGNTLQLARGVSLLGAALGEDTSKWLKYAAAAQGAMDTIGSAGSLVSKLPMQGKLAVAAGAITAAPFLYDRADQRARTADREAAVRGGWSSDAMERQNAAFRSQGNGGTGIHRQERGLIGQSLDFLGGIGRSLVSDGSDERIMSRQLVANASLGDARMKEFRDTNTLIGGRRSLMEDRAIMSAREGLGGMDAAGKLQQFDDRNAQFRANSDKAMAQGGVVGGTRGLQLASDRAGFEVDAAKERLDILKQVGNELQREKQLLVDNVKTAQTALDVERDRLKSTQARLGMADAGDLGKLETLGKKLNSGKDLNEQEARLAQQYGVGAEQVQKFAQNRFKQNLSPEAQAGLAPTQGVDIAERNMREARRDYDDLLPDIQEELQQINEDAEAIVDSLKELFKADHEFREKLKAALEQIKADQEKAGKDLQEAGIKGKKP